MISFGIPGVDLVIHEITGGNTARLEALIDLFVELFPEYAYAAARRRQKAQLPATANPLFVDHQWLIDIDGQAAAMADFKYVPRRDLGLGIYIAIKPTYRKLDLPGYRRLSEWLHVAVWAQLQEDAAIAARPTPLGLVVEVGSAKLVARYREYGLVELPIEYHEPRLPEGRGTLVSDQEPAVDAPRRGWLGIFPLQGQPINERDPALLTNAALAFLVDHYALPEDHWVVRRALNSIKHPYGLGEGEE